jgi:hypothetical protein
MIMQIKITYLRVESRSLDIRSDDNSDDEIDAYVPGCTLTFKRNHQGDLAERVSMEPSKSFLQIFLGLFNCKKKSLS